ncbi:MAG: hypothetical protein JNK64_25215 [Myxococcales bacterium]|nr:hypothetical protein [Myxococcales bacterium]
MGTTTITAEHEAATSVRMALAAVRTLIDDRARPPARTRERGSAPRRVVIAAPAADDDLAWHEAARISAAAAEQAARERYRRLRWAAIAALTVATAALITLGALRRADRAWAAARTAVRDQADAEQRFQAAVAAQVAAHAARDRAERARALAEERLQALRAIMRLAPSGPPLRATPPARPRAPAPPPTAPASGGFTPRCPPDVPLCD